MDFGGKSPTKDMLMERLVKWFQKPTEGKRRAKSKPKVKAATKRKRLSSSGKAAKRAKVAAPGDMSSGAEGGDEMSGTDVEAAARRKVMVKAKRQEPLAKPNRGGSGDDEEDGKGRRGAVEGDSDAPGTKKKSVAGEAPGSATERGHAQEPDAPAESRAGGEVPSSAALRREASSFINGFLQDGGDIESLTMRMVRNYLEDKFHVGLADRKKELKDIVAAAL